MAHRPGFQRPALPDPGGINNASKGKKSLVKKEANTRTPSTLLWPVALSCLCIAVQYISFFCSNQVVEDVFSLLGFDYSNSRFASISVNWCAKEDRSLIYKLCSRLPRYYSGEEPVTITRADSKAGVHAVVILFILFKSISWLLSSPRSLIHVPTALFQYVVVVGSLVLLSNKATGDQFMIGVLSIFGFLIAEPFLRLFELVAQNYFIIGGLSICFLSIQGFIIRNVHLVLCLWTSAIFMHATCFPVRISASVRLFVCRWLAAIAGVALWSAEKQAPIAVLFALYCCVVLVFLYQLLMPTIEHIKRRCDNNWSQFFSVFLCEFLLHDLSSLFRLFLILAALFVPFDKFYEVYCGLHKFIIADISDNFQWSHQWLSVFLSLSSAVAGAKTFGAVTLGSLVHCFLHNYKERQAEDNRTKVEVDNQNQARAKESAAKFNDDFMSLTSPPTLSPAPQTPAHAPLESPPAAAAAAATTAATAATTAAASGAKHTFKDVSQISIFVFFFNILKSLLKYNNVLLLPIVALADGEATLMESSSISKSVLILRHDIPLVSCDCLLILLLVYRTYLVKHPRHFKSMEWRPYVCPILVWMALNNLFFLSDQLSLPAGLHDLNDLLSKCIMDDWHFASQTIWSAVLHVAPFVNFIRLMFHQFLTMFENTTRVAPAQVLLKEFDTCYVIDFSGSHHDGARLDFSPISGSAAVFYQPYKNDPSVGAFVMEINGSTIPAIDFTRGLLKQPLSMCFNEAEHHASSHSQMFTVTSLTFRRFHSVKAALRLPSPIVFNRSMVPWVHATHWKATMFSESSLLPGRQRRMHPSCRSNKCRPVSLI
jgi:hypothetical protein